ncbi:MAG: hypothetical protein HKM89_06195 [Gemmatimonadales bacterium]|nr:hypothetical protein [Gemmatimonadales bacterium]
MNPGDLGGRLESLLAGDLAAWQGLPDIVVHDLEALFGDPVESSSVRVGAYSAQRLEFRAGKGRRTLVAFARDERVFMVEVLPPPDRNALAGLPEPTAVLPQEIAVEGAYAHEVLHAERGLLLTMAQRFEEPEPRSLVRCRGIRPLVDRRALGPELYMPLETDVKW